MAKMRTMQHNSRANSKGRTHGTKHNDRDFDTDLADNIDQEKSQDNVYWHLYQDEDPEMTFTEAELKFYTETFGEQLQKTNDNYLRQSHPERCKDMATWKMARQNAPEETVLQIGKMEGHADAATLMDCFQEYNRRLEQWNQEHGRPFTQLSYALHVDEAVPHIQTRRVWHYQDDKGMTRIGQEKALAKAGVELPDPNWNETRRNNRKVAFDKMTRGMWLEVLQERGLDIEQIPVPDGKHNREKEEMIRDKYQEISDETARLEEKREDLTAQLQEKNLAYNKAVGQEIEQRMDPYPERIERKPAPFGKGKVIVSEQDLNDLERRASLNTAHKATLAAAEAQLTDKTNNADAYIDGQVALLRADMERAIAEAKEQKQTMFVKEADYHFAAAEARQAKVEAMASKSRYDKMYEGQLTVNEELQATKAENADLKANMSDRIQKAVEAAERPLQRKIDEQQKEITGLKSWIETLESRIEFLRESLSKMMEKLTNIVKAVGMLKYDKSQGFKIDGLTKKQDRLIEGIAEYGAAFARKEGFKDEAEDMDKHVEISTDLRAVIEPKGQSGRDER